MFLRLVVAQVASTPTPMDLARFPGTRLSEWMRGRRPLHNDQSAFACRHNGGQEAGHGGRHKKLKEHDHERKRQDSP